jgi:TATA-binding protein-associated factor
MPLAALAPTLFPFFRHTIPSVRLAVVNTLYEFLMVPSVSNEWISQPFACLLFQNLILEERADIRETTFKTWKLAFQQVASTAGRLEDLTTGPLMGWFTILMNPLGSPLDSNLFFQANLSQGGHNVDKPMMLQDFSLVSQEAVLRGRVAGAKAISFLLSIWPVEVS